MMKVLHCVLLLGCLCAADSALAQEQGGKRPPPAPASAPQPAQATVDQELENVAQLFIEKGDLPAALEIYDELRADHPDNFNLLDTTIELCRKIAACKPRQLSLLKELEEFVARNPKSAEARVFLADYATQLGKFGNARKAIELMIKAKPKALETWLLLVEHHDEAKEFRKLDALLLDLTKKFPKSSEIWYRIADRALVRDDRRRAKYALAQSKRYAGKGDTDTHKRRNALERELKAMIRAEIRAKHRDFRQDTRWADLEDDFAHSTYP
ncbi:MAG: tetratricopeptide repeat protein [Myxococcales bacterium]|nr:tetratricopeptide repeat protein [Myxococcales bacterium]